MTLSQSVTPPQQPASQHPGHSGVAAVGQPVNRVEWFRQMPTGSTVYVRPNESESK
ncbi:hypothetical protein Lesp02_32940 [Lentzea sp. NBRC 105346]|nr:hypothetical protein Lesp02_32940 [Lentzea sp. NBRC 105346]